mmetsp:Transcript_118319/g.287079  ORF Transcript_118319/g.287079 Transcript_118319/m.287079 type:complete len:241 (-) Transcript_118319:503-1225(-)
MKVIFIIVGVMYSSPSARSWNAFLTSSRVWPGSIRRWIMNEVNSEKLTLPSPVVSSSAIFSATSSSDITTPIPVAQEWNSLRLSVSSPSSSKYSNTSLISLYCSGVTFSSRAARICAWMLSSARSNVFLSASHRARTENNVSRVCWLVMMPASVTLPAAASTPDTASLEEYSTCMACRAAACSSSDPDRLPQALLCASVYCATPFATSANSRRSASFACSSSRTAANSSSRVAMRLNVAT